MTNRGPVRSSVLICLAVCALSIGQLPPVLSAADEHPPRYPDLLYVQSAEVKAWLEEGRPVTFLDVREPDEFQAGHLQGARNIVWEQIASLADQLPHDQPIVVYCIHSAHRAPEAAKTLRALGFDNAYVLEGGIVAWQAGGQMILASNPHQSPTILLKTERCSQAAHP